jgi:predicted DsbA family dithiol-disulfide isomerase
LHPEELDADGLRKHAQANGLNMDQFRACMQSEKYKTAVQKDVIQATSIAVAATPSFILAKTGKELTGNMIEEARPYPFFDFNIKQILNAQTPGASVDVVDLHGHGSQ